MCSTLDEKIKEWLSWDKNPTTKSYIESLSKQDKRDVLSDLLLKRLSFGTAGLRGKMGAGYSAMNDLVIIQTGQGLLAYLEENEKTLLENNGVVVGYDGRHNSRRYKNGTFRKVVWCCVGFRWAELTATIFINKGYKVRLFSKVNPTPLVAFAAKMYRCAIGVMVTASHNPKEDNGYKVDD